ncbi:MAG: GTPase [Candidatus Thorarchaeota archaeon]
MPTNVSPEFEKQRQIYEDTEDLEQRIVELQKLISLAPDHKGAKKMVSDYKKKLAHLRAELERRREQERSRRGGTEEAIRKEGAGQICLLGVTNSGKSTLINAVTNANLPTADYPFTTSIPTPAMMTYEDVNIQLVELPGLFDGCYDSSIGRQSLSLARNTDCIAIVIDLSQDVETQIRIILNELDRARIRLNKEKSAVRVEKTGSGGHMIYGIQNFQGTRDEIIEYLKSRRILNIIVRFQKPATFDQLVDALDSSVAYVRAMIVATKGDLPGSAERFQELRDKYGDRFDMVPISALKGENLDAMRKTMFEHLDILRVYTKVPGKKPEEKPLVLPEGSVVEDAAEKIHKELFVERFRTAIILREDDKIRRRQVGLNYPLRDGDIVQFLHK